MEIACRIWLSRMYVGKMEEEDCLNRARVGLDLGDGASSNWELKIIHIILFIEMINMVTELQLGQSHHSWNHVSI